MARINLLPWREELRRRKQRDFFMLAAVTVVAMGGVVAGVHAYFQGLIDHQQRRNDFLTQEIKKLDTKIAAIKDLETEKRRLLARMGIIQQLQSSRPEVVHLMDELVDTLPEGVYYTKVQQKGRKLNLEGIAQSNARVSSLMRQLDGSTWLEDPALIEIKRERSARQQTQVRLSTFNLNIAQTKQKKQSDVEDDGDEQAPAGESGNNNRQATSTDDTGRKPS